LKRLKKKYGCPVELSLEFIGGKWRTVILSWLKEAPHRYGDLRRRMPGLSDKVLTQRLKELETQGLVSRAANTYVLTPRGESLRPILGALYAWGVSAAAELKVRIEPRE
jgi:DNA-binding HxlR family transcriptional regulator